MKDPSIKIKLCEEHKEYILNNCIHLQNIPEKIKTIIENSNNDAIITIDEIKWLRENQGGLRLYQILEKSEMLLPSPEEIERNPALEARIHRLKIEAAEREYKTITKNVDTTRVRQPDESIAHQVKEMNRQLIGVVQLIISTGAGFLFGFLGLQLLIGELNLGSRLLLGIFCALLVAVAELYFLAKKLSNEDPYKKSS